MSPTGTAVLEAGGRRPCGRQRLVQDVRQRHRGFEKFDTDAVSFLPCLVEPVQVPDTDVEPDFVSFNPQPDRLCRVDGGRNRRDDQCPAPADVHQPGPPFDFKRPPERAHDFKPDTPPSIS